MPETTPSVPARVAVPLPVRRPAVVAALLLASACGGGGQGPAAPDDDPSPNQSPAISSFTASPQSGTEPLDVAFTLSCADPDGSIVTYRLDYENDGTFDVSRSSSISGHTHTYREDATARGQCEDDDGATATTTLQITVEPANQPPDVSIESPADSSTFTEGEEITFQGSAEDPEEGALGGSALVWSSDVDGQLGTGASVTTGGLSAGSHTVTLEATDSEGATGSADVRLTVEAAGGSGSAAPSIQSVSPDPLVEGAGATVTGRNFEPGISGNTVLVDGVEATVSSASVTELGITVPRFDCRPRRSASVRVVARGDTSEAVTATVDPGAAPLSLAPGERVVLEDPADDFCVRFEESSSSEEYLVGIQSVTPTLGLTSVILSAETGGAGSGSGSVAPSGRRTAPPAGPSPGPEGGWELRAPDAWNAHYRAESRLRAWEAAHLGTRMGEGLPRRRGAWPLSPSHGSSIPGSVSEGDTVALRVPQVHATDLCSGFDAISGVVRKIGAHGIWVEDVANPDSGYAAGDWSALSDAFDDLVYATDSAYFGDPTDVDGNGRVVLVVSKAVNEAGGVLGFVFGGDLLARSSCASSDEGEFTYLVAPDPLGLHGPEWTAAELRKDNPRLVAHELTHMIQFGVRSSCAGCSPMPAFIAEGQATLAEELNGHAETGRSPGNDYGASVAFSSTPREWYDNRFVDLAFYFGYGGSGTHFDAAPEACSWLARDWAGVCAGTRGVYGVPSTIMRWMADHFAPGHPGGEEGFFREMTANTATGFANWEDLTGLTIEEILASWGPMLWLDGRVTGVEPLVTLPSWNLADIYGNVVVEARLQPRARSFADFSDSLGVNAGSAAYFLIGDGARPPTAVRARAPGGAVLPAFMQMWVVRTR